MTSVVFSQQENTQQRDVTATPYPQLTDSASAPMDLSISTDAYGAFPQIEQELYHAVVTSGNIEPTLCSETVPAYIFSNQASPCVLPEDRDRKLASSTSLSPRSSIAASPESNPSHIGSVDWTTSAGVSLQPGIVGTDYMAEYPAFTGAGVEDFSSFDFAAQHPKSFVGKLNFHFTCLS